MRCLYIQYTTRWAGLGCVGKLATTGIFCVLLIAFFVFLFHSQTVNCDSDLANHCRDCLERDYHPSLLAVPVNCDCDCQSNSHISAFAFASASRCHFYDDHV